MTDQDSVAGFELMVKPSALFADELRDDPLLSDWNVLNVVGDFRKEGIQCYFDTDLPAGQEELERALYRAVVEPIERLRLGPILYREVKAGRLRAARIGLRRDIRIHRDWVTQWLIAMAEPVEIAPLRRVR